MTYKVERLPLSADRQVELWGALLEVLGEINIELHIMNSRTKLTRVKIVNPK